MKTSVPGNTYEWPTIKLNFRIIDRSEISTLIYKKIMNNQKKKFTPQNIQDNAVIEIIGWLVPCVASAKTAVRRALMANKMNYLRGKRVVFDGRRGRG